MPPVSIPANDFKALWADLGTDVLAAVERVGASGWYVLGSEVSEFETDLAAFHGVDHAIGCASGLDAIEIAIRAAGIGPGDEVMTTPLTAFATALAILRAGATPRFVDVDEQGLLDLESVEQGLVRWPSIRAVIPVHLYGHVLDVEALCSIATAHGAIVIEDAAQAIGGAQNGAPVGSTTLGAATSFYPTKNLGAFGDGGALLTNDPAIADTARTLRDYGQQAKYEHVVPGLNSRLDELQAGILRTAVLPRLRRALDRRAAIAACYREQIHNPKLRLPAPPSASTWHLFPVFASDHGAREALRLALAEACIGTAVHYPILASAQLALAAPEPTTIYPTAARLAETELSLPIHPYLSDDAVDRVITACNAW